jgi:hypothetical protein
VTNETITKGSKRMSDDQLEQLEQGAAYEEFEGSFDTYEDAENVYGTYGEDE